MTGKRILAIGAHPDDIEFGCGGALCRFSEKGDSVYMMVMSKGEKGGDARLRVEEQMEAAGILGAKELFWGDLTDTRITVSQESIQKIEDLIAKIRPDYIFCHYHEDSHQDHRHLAQMAISAARYVPNVLFYEGPTTERFMPQVYVDITTTLTQKVKALLAHRSQVEKTNIENVSIIEIAHSCANFRGIQGRVQYAEAFFALRLFISL